MWWVVTTWWWEKLPKECYSQLSGTVSDMTEWIHQWKWCILVSACPQNCWGKILGWSKTGGKKGGGRDSEDLVLKCSCFLGGFYWILAVCCQWCTPDETSSRRCCLCASDCWVRWKQVEERTDILLSGVGFCAKGLNQGNRCFWQRIYSQLLVFS